MCRLCVNTSFFLRLPTKKRLRLESSLSDEELNDDTDTLLNDDPHTPFYSKQPVTDIKALLKIFQSAFEATSMCTKTPYRCTTPGTFLINMSELHSHKDVLCDGLGIYRNNSCDWYHYTKDWSRTSDKNRAWWEVKSTHFKLRRDSSFMRRVVELRKNDGDSKTNTPVYAIVIYKFQGPVHGLPPMDPHGNQTRNDKQFTRIKPSVRDETKKPARKNYAHRNLLHAV